MESPEETEEERQRKVRFHGRVQFKTIRHVADFSDGEISDGWYRKPDFIRMSDEVAEIAKLLADGKETHKGEELSIRGLEHLVEEDVADYRAEKMIASIDAVLDEQDDQADEDVYDPDMIAEIYGEIVSPLLREAYLVGLRDAKEGAAAAALIPDLEEPSVAMETEKTEIDAQPPEPEVTPPETNVDPLGESSHEEYADLAPMAPEADDNDDVDEGCLKLNTSLSSIGTEVHPEKRAPLETKKSSQEKKSQKSRDKQSATDENGPKSPTRKSVHRRKTFDRKGGTELSPFVFRRDGTIKFRNFDVEHRKREQSKVRKDTIKSSMFKFLDDEDEGDDIAKLIENSAPKKKNRKPAVGVPRTKLY
ncbi:MAG: hypothetical protein SGILL_001400 [Bacillariaceae sp.]